MPPPPSNDRNRKEDIRGKVPTMPPPLSPPPKGKKEESSNTKEGAPLPPPPKKRSPQMENGIPTKLEAVRAGAYKIDEKAERRKRRNHGGPKQPRQVEEKGSKDKLRTHKHQQGRDMDEDQNRRHIKKGPSKKKEKRRRRKPHEHKPSQFSSHEETFTERSPNRRAGGKVKAKENRSEYTSDMEEPVRTPRKRLDEAKRHVEVVSPKKGGISDDPKYAKYRKMLGVGVPQGAVLQTMKKDGISPPKNFFEGESFEKPHEETPKPQMGRGGAGFQRPRNEAPKQLSPMKNEVKRRPLPKTPTEIALEEEKEKGMMPTHRPLPTPEANRNGKLAQPQERGKKKKKGKIESDDNAPFFKRMSKRMSRKKKEDAAYGYAGPPPPGLGYSTVYERSGG